MCLLFIFMLWYSVCTIEMEKIFLYFTILASEGQRTTLKKEVYKWFFGLFLFQALLHNLIIVVYDNCHIYILRIYFMHICLQMLSPYCATCCILDF